MIFNINLTTFEHLAFWSKNKFRKDDHVSVIDDGIYYKLNPDEDSICYENNIIPLKEFFLAFKKSREFMEKNHKEWFEHSSDPFILTFYEMNGNAMSFNETRNNKKVPTEIKMCLSHFNDIHDFKFVLGHEVGHFHENLSWIHKPITDLVCTIFSACLIVIGLILTICFFSSIEHYFQPLISFFLFSLIFVLIMFYLPYIALSIPDNISSHKAEYEADLFSLNLFSECSHQYFTRSLLFNDSHPSQFCRTIALKFNIRLYFPLVLPWNLKHCDSYTEYKEKLVELVPFIKNDLISFLFTFDKNPTAIKTKDIEQKQSSKD